MSQPHRPSPTLRIALFAETFLPKVDGIVNTLCRLLEFLQREGIEALVFAPNGAPEHYAGHRVIGLPALPMPFYPELRTALLTSAGRRELAAFDPNLVLVANPLLMGVAAKHWARARGIPVAASYHTDVPGFVARWGLRPLVPLAWAGMRMAHRGAALNLCPSRATADELAEHGFDHLAIWGRGVDSRRFSPAKRSNVWRTKLSGGEPDRPLLLYVGRLSPEKRVDWLIDLLDRLPEARLAIVGDGPEWERLEVGFAGRPAVFTGYLRGDALAGAFASADHFVFTGANETLGNVVLEAMASGLPVVAPASGGVLEHVRHEETGLLFAPESPDDLAVQTRRLLREPDLAAGLAVRARAHAEANTWEAELDRLVARFRALVDGRSGAALAGLPSRA